MKESKYSYDFPKGLMDGYVRIPLDDFCSWGKCFLGYGGCPNHRPIYDACEIWKIPKILKEIKKTLKQAPATKFFLETPSFFDPEKMLDESRFQFQELLTTIDQQSIDPYLSVQATPRDLIYFLNDRSAEHRISPKFIRKAGIQEIWLGVESANAELRRKYGKLHFENDELEKAMVELRSAGIKCCFYLVVSTEDTDETIQETVDFVRKTKPAQICPFDLFHFIGGEHYIDWENVRANLDKVARYQKILKDLAEEINQKEDKGGC